MRRLIAIVLGCILATSTQATESNVADYIPTEFCDPPVFIIDGEPMEILDVYLDLIEITDATRWRSKSVDAYIYIGVERHDETRITGVAVAKDDHQTRICHSYGTAIMVGTRNEPHINVEIFSGDYETTDDTFGYEAFKKIRRMILKHGDDHEQKAMYHVLGHFTIYTNFEQYFRVEEINLHLTPDE